MVLVVLFYPPGPVDAYQEADEQSQAIIVAVRPENLFVAQIVAQEAKLHGDERQKCRIQQLNPDVVHQCQD